MTLGHAPKDIPWISRKVTALSKAVVFVAWFVGKKIISVITYVREALLETITAWLGKTQCIDCLLKDVEIARANERTAQTGEKSLNWQKLWREEQGRAEALQDKLDTLSGINRAMSGVSEPEVKAFGGFQSLRSRTQQATRESLEKRNKARTEEQ